MGKVDGIIQKVDAEPGNIYDIKSVLIEIIPTSTKPGARPAVGR
jgi:hypothetical protein